MRQEIKNTDHNQTIKFFSDTTLKVRGFRPLITEKDAGRLKTVLKMNILSQEKVEQLILYFLADKNYKNLGPSLATLLSSTILNSLRDRTINRSQFYKELEAYSQRYLNIKSKQTNANNTEEKKPESMANLIQQVIEKMKIQTSNLPRAPVVRVRQGSLFTK